SGKEGEPIDYKEDPTVGALIQVDVLCHSATVGVRVRRGEQVEYRNISWNALEREETNPLLPLIDAAIEAIVGKQPCALRRPSLKPSSPASCRDRASGTRTRRW